MNELPAPISDLAAALTDAAHAVSGASAAIKDSIGHLSIAFERSCLYICATVIAGQVLRVLGNRFLGPTTAAKSGKEV